MPIIFWVFSESFISYFLFNFFLSCNFDGTNKLLGSQDSGNEKDRYLDVDSLMEWSRKEQSKEKEGKTWILSKKNPSACRQLWPIPSPSRIQKKRGNTVWHLRKPRALCPKSTCRRALKSKLFSTSLTSSVQSRNGLPHALKLTTCRQEGESKMFTLGCASSRWMACQQFIRGVLGYRKKSALRRKIPGAPWRSRVLYGSVTN